MATEKQIKANRENSKLAGVKTPEGKTVSRHNSFKHGLTCRSLLDKYESYSETQEMYEQILSGFSKAFSPRNEYESALIETMAMARIKMFRSDVFEADSFNESNELFSTGRMLTATEHLLSLAIKYRGQIEASFYRAFTALMQCRQSQEKLDSFLPEGGVDGST